MSLSFAKSLSLSVSNIQMPSLKIGTILNPNVFVSRTKFITLYISVPCAMEALSILLNNSLTGFLISGLLCLVRYNNHPTPDLYMDCVSHPHLKWLMVVCKLHARDLAETFCHKSGMVHTILFTLNTHLHPTNLQSYGWSLLFTCLHTPIIET